MRKPDIHIELTPEDIDLALVMHFRGQSDLLAGIREGGKREHDGSEQ